MTTTTTADRRGPPFRDLALEGPRTWAAYVRFTALAPLLAMTPKGDGHPVLVLPGYLASDLSTVPLRTFLGRLGYQTHGWRLGRNVGPTNVVVDGLTRAVQELSRSHDRTLSIVGWSLGGVFGRDLARRFPEAIRQVISLGSPFNVVDAVRFGALPATPGPLPVPSTAIYTRSDGIVAWRSTVQHTDERSENVEVRGSHCGLGVNPAAVLAIADRLAQREGGWAPFRPPPAVRRWYPRPWPGDVAEADVEAQDQAWTA